MRYGPDAEPDGEWSLSCHTQDIPDSPAAGRHGGEPFTVRNAHVKDEILTLSDGTRYRYEGQFTIFLFFGLITLTGMTCSNDLLLFIIVQASSSSS